MCCVCSVSSCCLVPLLFREGPASVDVIPAAIIVTTVLAFLAEFKLHSLDTSCQFVVDVTTVTCL